MIVIHLPRHPPPNIIGVSLDKIRTYVYFHLIEILVPIPLIIIIAIGAGICFMCFVVRHYRSDNRNIKYVLCHISNYYIHNSPPQTRADNRDISLNTYESRDRQDNLATERLENSTSVPPVTITLSGTSQTTVGEEKLLLHSKEQETSEGGAAISNRIPSEPAPSNIDAANIVANPSLNTYIPENSEAPGNIMV